MQLQAGATGAVRAAEAARPGARHLPIVALTANALKGDRERCLSAGMDNYMTKPVDPKVLATTLARWLAGGPVPRAA